MIDRRTFLRDTSSCATHLALAAASTTLLARAAWAARPVGRPVAIEPFGRLEQVAEGVWALVSTPLAGDRTTLSNGGLIAGRSGVLAIEGFMTPAGARWLAAQSKTLTGRWPTHVAVTHYHADHTNGVAGYVSDESRPKVYATDATRTQVLERNQPADRERSAALASVIALDPLAQTTIDLGGRTVRLVPRGGHTASDVTIGIDDPSVVFCGDLVWNGMIPNYVDTVPTQLAASVAALRRSRETTYVPGHGAVATAADVERYVAVLGEIENAARKALADGVPAEQAAARFTLPPSLGEWLLFGPAFYPRAFAAWARELRR
ncbi:MAG: MBL fold metallo-hydrolase [Gemmatimonadaceae bacterium]|nr:MBL fold metallo-hydrolase [Gemmatimonadaceae bacterium]